MEPKSTLPDQLLAKMPANSIIGQIERLDDQGQVSRTWRLQQPRCTLGTGPECVVRIDDQSMNSVHALVVFGRNHTLIRAMGGQVRVAGRAVREWLIDEPTLIQCGASRFVVYPTSFVNLTKQANHRVSAGSLVDQAARLRAGDIDAISSITETAEHSLPPTQSNSAPLAASSETSAAAGILTGQTLIAKLDADDFKSVLQPLHLAIQSASEGILELTRLAQEAPAIPIEPVMVQNNLTDVTQAIESLETRVSSISQYCENLLANVSESIDDRMSRLDDFIAKLAATPSLTPPDSPASYDVEHAPDFCPAPEVYGEGHQSFAQPTNQRASQPNFEETAPTPLDYYAQEDRLSTNVAELPSWFTQGAVSEGFSEPAEEASAESLWSSAQLNPIYAEDTNGWLEKDGLAEEDVASDAMELQSYPSPQESELEIADRVRSETESTFEEENDSDYESESVVGYSYADLASDTYHGTEEASDMEEPEADHHEFTSQLSANISGDGQEDSIEDYMARLLERVRGGPGTPETAPSKTSVMKTPGVAEKVEPPKADSEPIAIASTTQSSPSNFPSTPLPSIKNTEFLPRQAAPEKSTDLKAFRNLANNNARQAIQTSSRKKIELSIISNVGIASLGLIGAVLLLVLNGFSANVAMIGMIASCIVFLLWGYEAVVHLKHLQAVKAVETSESTQSE